MSQVFAMGLFSSFYVICLVIHVLVGSVIAVSVRVSACG
jgi:hypothetical protein